MFKNILIPVDFSRKNKKALDVAVNIATRYKGDIQLLHVVEIIANTAFTELEEFYAKLEKRAERNMEKLIAPYLGCKVKIGRRIVYGNRVQEILNYTRSRHIDMIIMNSHKIDPKNPTQGWGTISHKIVIMSPCPVMLVK
jgi:nucleotide-binding universal stress UspA family protein